MRTISALLTLLLASNSLAGTITKFACTSEKDSFTPSQLETNKKFQRARGKGVVRLYREGTRIRADIAMNITFEEPIQTNRPATSGQFRYFGLEVRRISLPRNNTYYDAAAIIVPSSLNDLGIPSLLTVNAPYLLRPTSRFPYRQSSLSGVYVSRCGLVDDDGRVLDNQSIGFDLSSLPRQSIESMGYLD